jgi:hypothetical protein
LEESFYEEFEQVFEHFPKYHIKILVGDIFKPTVGNDNVHQDRNDNSVRIVNYATSMKLFSKRTMFPHRNIHKFS